MNNNEVTAASVGPSSWYRSSSVRVVAACFVLSGMTGLIYEVVWARMLGLVFGATTLAVSTVLASFMGGLALGGVIAGKYAARLRRPLRVYGLIEIGIAIYALLIPWIFRVADHLYALLWQHLHPNFYIFSLWRFVLSGATLLVPTTLMGATLPVLAAMLVRTRTFQSTSITRLYTYNLLGAIFGTILAGFFLLPRLGLLRTILAAGLINIFIGLIAVLLDRGDKGLPDSVDETTDESAGSPVIESELENGSNGSRFWFACAFVSGFVTISTQVAWTRVLTMVIGSSTYAFSIVVALFLTGLSLGAFDIARKKNRQNLRRTLFRIELGTGVALLLSLWIVNQMPQLLVRFGLGLNISSWGGLLALQIMCAAILIVFPAYLMGTVMPLVLVWAGRSSSR
ncbi:MAG TPA: fused MFS/spermidine synthase, partial [Pyrinomonadaceae bacterium]|nr:fused MFS/spermidine synthase [Pyrinomonadaceae bacterium]